MKSAFVSKLVAVLAAIVMVFAAVPAPSFAGPDINMACDSSATLPPLQADDQAGQTWRNPCGTPAFFSVIFAQGLWNHGDTPPYNELVPATGNPNSSAGTPNANPACRGAELTYVINGEYSVYAPQNCYSQASGTVVPTNGTLTLVNNDKLGRYSDNSGSQNLFVQNVRLSPGVRTLEDIFE